MKVIRDIAKTQMQKDRGLSSNCTIGLQCQKSLGSNIVMVNIFFSAKISAIEDDYQKKEMTMQFF